MNQEKEKLYQRFSVNVGTSVFGFIYVANKQFLQYTPDTKEKLLDKLTQMNIGALVNIDDEDIIFKDNEVQQLTPKSREKDKPWFQKAQAISAMLNDFVIKKKENVILFGTGNLFDCYGVLVIFFNTIGFQFIEKDGNNVLDANNKKIYQYSIDYQRKEISRPLNGQPLIMVQAKQLGDIEQVERSQYKFELQSAQRSRCEVIIRQTFILEKTLKGLLSNFIDQNRFEQSFISRTKSKSLNDVYLPIGYSVIASVIR
ncbi:hypothetical protein pb186bvf_006124 [Paramecium bursaria]